MALRFGTDGWRAVIAGEFTFKNVRRVCAGIAGAMRPAAGDPMAVIGFDTRFLSARFAEAAAGTLIARGWRVRLADAPAPTPAVSCACVAWGATCGIVITASHNPGRFNGVKVKVATGASAPDDVTRAIEQAIPDRDPPAMDPDAMARSGRFERVSLVPPHVDRLARMVDLPALRSAGWNIVVDAMHGSAGGLLESLLSGGATRVTTIHRNPDPLFGGRHPEPLEGNLTALRDASAAAGADAAFATDGDGDRIGAFDDRGAFVSPLRIAPLIAWNLLERGLRGPLGKTFANTILLDRIADRYGLPFRVFPVGFKHIAGEFVRDRMLLGGEESGGIGVAGYVPERDGTLISLLLLRAMLDSGRSLSSLVEEMGREFGTLHYRRVDLPVPPDRGRRLVAILAARRPRRLGGMEVTDHDPLDGLKLLFGREGWILFRPSGTEPVLRIYCEAPTPGAVDAAIAEARALLDGLPSSTG